jgi:hypothetical protein
MLRMDCQTYTRVHPVPKLMKIINSAAGYLVRTEIYEDPGRASCAPVPSAHKDRACLDQGPV